MTIFQIKIIMRPKHICRNDTGEITAMLCMVCPEKEYFMRIFYLFWLTP
jgi:hypothetical protein